MIIYCCPNCKMVDIGEENETKTCLKCSSAMRSLGISTLEWNKYNSAQMENAINKCLNPGDSNTDIECNDLENGSEAYNISPNLVENSNRVIPSYDFSSIMFSGENNKARKDLAMEYLFEVLKYSEKKRTSDVYIPYVEDSILVLEYCNKLTSIKDLEYISGNEQRTSFICTPLCEAGLMEKQYIENYVRAFRTLPLYRENMSCIEKEALTKDVNEIERELRSKNNRQDISFDTSKILGSKENAIKYFQKIVNLETSLYSIKNRYCELTKMLIKNVIKGLEGIKKEDSQIVNSINCIKNEMVYIVTLMDKTIDTIYELFSYGCIYGKYRNYIAVSTFCDYYLSGRCSTLDGPDGAYNIYEQEVRADRIISQLDQVLTSLEQIKDNQYYIYNEIKTSNEQLGLINGQLLFNNATQVVQIGQLDEIINNTEQTALNTQVSAFYSKKNAELTDALGFLTALK